MTACVALAQEVTMRIAVLASCIVLVGCNNGSMHTYPNGECYFSFRGDGVANTNRVVNADGSVTCQITFKPTKGGE